MFANRLCGPYSQHLLLQVTVYSSIVKSRMISQLISGSSSLDALPAITLLRKLCNHPHLITDDLEKQQHLGIGIGSQLLKPDADSPALSKFSGEGLKCKMISMQASQMKTLIKILKR